MEVISKLPPPSYVTGVHSFLDHAYLYRSSVKNFSKIEKHITYLLVKEATFDFSNKCLKAFDCLKEQLISAPVVVAFDWSLSFEIMCDASDTVVGSNLKEK